MVVVIECDEMNGLVARYIIQLYVLIHAQRHNEADTTVRSRIARLICIHIAPLEVPDGGIPRVIDGHDW